MLEITDLTVAYGGVIALEKVSLSVPEGSITAVLGANGAGKTTLVRTISGLVRPRHGSVMLGDHQLVGRSPEAIARLGVGHVPEGHGIVSELTVEENLRLGGLWRRDRADQRVAIEEAYELFPPLRVRRAVHASNLSGGERQMLSIGRAMVARPTALLLDEPSLGLATGLLAQIMQRLVVTGARAQAERVAHRAERAVRTLRCRPGNRAVAGTGRTARQRRASCGRRRAPPRVPRLLTVHLFVIYTVAGITNGMVYAAVALALVMIWRSTRIINYAQGAMAMFTTYVALEVIRHGAPYWLGFLVALLTGFVLGAIIERVLVRPVESRPPLNAVILSLGVLILLEAVAPMLFGGQTQSFPVPVSNTNIVAGSTSLDISPFDLFTIGAVLVAMMLLFLVFQRTTLGLRMRAAAFNPEIARILGIRVGRMLTLGWGLAALLGALAGTLAAPSVYVYPSNMDEVLVFGFTGAIIGGLESPAGAVIGAVAVGLALSYVSGYIGSDLAPLGGFVILIVVLMLRPQGLFSFGRQRQV